jgi:uncharacterized protein
LSVDPRLRKIIKALKRYDPERVILFGSAARGAADAQSDIDILVVKETTDRFLDRLAHVYDLVEPDFALDALVYTPGEWAEMRARRNPFVERVLKEGVTIYERPKRRSGTLARPGRVRSARRANQRFP